MQNISIFLIVSILSLLSCKKDGVLDLDEARIAYEYLNKVRNSPSDYSSDIGVDLTYVSSTHQLIWNETLALVAQNKALDMAKHNYFEHVDSNGDGINIKIHEAGYIMIESWVSDRSLNYFESIGAGYNSGIELINGLIEDKGIDPPGHRNHLLGITDFWADCYDIGIGHVTSKNSDYPTYSCIIIAKHDF